MPYTVPQAILPHVVLAKRCRMSSGRDLPANVQTGVVVGSLLRRFFAAACILALAGIGIYCAWLARPDVRNILTILAATLAPATAYTFGYFRCLPDALGTVHAMQERTPWQRWSDFAGLSAFVASCLVALNWGFNLPEAISSGRPREGVGIVLGVLVVTSAMAACVVASEEYLAGTMARGNATGGSGWRASARRVVSRWGAALMKPLRAKRSLTLGSVLALASLILNTTVVFGCNEDIPHRGYEIVSGKAVWVTAQSVDGAAALEVIVAQAGRWTYVLGLAISVAILAAVLAGGTGDALRRSRALMVSVGSLALFFICDYTLGWARFGIVPEELTSAVWTVVWILPIALWLCRARGDARRWEHTRLAVMVFYLPIFFAFFYLLPFLAPYAPGYISFVIGMLLLWWGLVQSQREVSSPG